MHPPPQRRTAAASTSSSRRRRVATRSRLPPRATTPRRPRPRCATTAASRSRLASAGTPGLFWHVQYSSGFFLDKGVVAWLYNPSAPNSSAYRLIPAIVSNSFFDFHGTAGPYTLIVDANGYLSHEEPITLGTTPNPHDVKLNAAPPELYQTIAAYGPTDWSNLTVWRNLTLNPDSTL